MKKRWIVVLDLKSLSDSLKIEKAKEIYAGMAGNAYFPAPDPSMADLNGQIEKTDLSYLNSRDAGTQETAIFHNDLEKLELYMQDLASYVQVQANKHPETGDEVILSAGMKIKEEGEVNIQDFSVKVGTVPGTAVARAKAFPGKVAYVWQFTTPEVNEFATKAITVKATYLFTALDSDQKYKFRMAIVTKDGQGPWSTVISLMIL